MFLICLFLLSVILLYSYFYFSFILNIFYDNPEEMKLIWFKNFGKYWIKILNFFGLFDKIEICFNEDIKDSFNLVLMNHHSIFDNFILCKILGNVWNNTKTVSKYSNRSIQNKVMKIHGNMLVNNNVKSLSESKEVINHWREKDILNVILFPEGTTYQNSSNIDNKKAKILKSQMLEEYNFDQTIIPYDGAFNLLIEKLQDDIEYIYDVTTIYTINNKRIYGNEWKILSNLFNSNFKIHVNIEKYSLENKVINIDKTTFKIKVGKFLSKKLFNVINTVLDKNPKIIIFTQHIKGIFNIGLDLNSQDDKKELLDSYLDLSRRLLDFKGLILCKVDGMVRGGGMLFPAISDICYCTERSTFGLPEINVGMIPGIVSTLLNKKLNVNKVKYYSLTGEPFNSNVAFELGLVNSIYEDKSWNSLIRRLKKNTDNGMLIKKYAGYDEPEYFGSIMGEFMLKKSKKINNYSNKVTKFKTEGNIGILTMCDNKYKNTFTEQMCDEINDIVNNLNKNIKVIILRSELDNFHVGVNPYTLRKMGKESKIEIAHLIKSSYYSFLNLFKLDIPIISILNGKVYGGGIPIALWSDYRIVTEDIDIHYGNITRGMSPAGQLSSLLKENVNRRDIMEFYFQNLHWNNKDCLDKGIANLCCKNKEDALISALKLARYISKNSIMGIKNTLKLLRVEHSEKIINEEAWLIANAISSKNVFNNIKSQDEILNLNHNLNIESVSSKPINEVVENVKNDYESNDYGIIAMEVYTPKYCINSNELKKQKIMTENKYLQKQIAVWDPTEDTVSISMTAVNNLLKKININVKDIGKLEVGTESSVDLAKSIKSYLMDLFDENRELQGVDNINACYGGVSALINSLNWLKVSVNNKYAIVVATDLALMNTERISFQGGGACAMLLGRNPKISISEEMVSYMKNTHDFLKPIKSKNLGPYCNGYESMIGYHESLKYCLEKFKERYGKSVKDFDHIAIHGGLCKVFVMNTFKKVAEWENIDYEELKKKFVPSTIHGERIGGLYTASLFFSLHSLLEHTEDIKGKDILLFGYGSGSCSSLFSAHINDKPENFSNLSDYLDNRVNISYDKLVDNHNRHSLMLNNGELTESFEKVNDTYYLNEYNNENNIRKYKLN